VTGADLRLASFALAVRDLDEALGFYLDVLGFEVRDGAGGVRRVAVGPPSQPDVRIVLLESPGDERTAEGCLVFATDDCDATFEHIEAADAEVLQEPISRPGGVRDCAFLDPSGNLLRFTQS
jgi:predicted enzyme related to lactoylglutathione lyase